MRIDVPGRKYLLVSRPGWLRFFDLNGTATMVFDFLV